MVAPFKNQGCDREVKLGEVLSKVPNGENILQLSSHGIRCNR